MENIIIVDENDTFLSPKVAMALVDIEKQIKALKNKEDEIKKALLEEMEARQILKIETDTVSVSYVAKYDRESLDSKKLRAEKPDLFDEYVRITPVSPSIRIKVKE